MESDNHQTSSMNQSGNSAPTGLTLPQDKELDVTGERHGFFYVRYLYARSHDSRVAEPAEKGQDFVSFLVDQKRLVFVICDGVSGSFFGDVAARYLGEHLMDWLWKTLPSLRGNESRVRQELAQFLNALAQNSDAQLALPDIPRDQPDMVQRVLEKKKNEIGSETTFACGSIELPDPTTVSPRGTLFLAWMGNTEIQVWRNRNGLAVEDLEATWDDKFRWSTKHGILGGEPATCLQVVDDLSHLIVYTDGLSELRDKLGRLLSDQELRESILHLDASPKSDDISYLEINLAPWWWKLPEAGLSRPVVHSCRWSDGVFCADWEPISGADYYLVSLRRESDANEIAEQVTEHSWKTNVGVTNGTLTFSVRAGQKDGLVGPATEWSVRLLTSDKTHPDSPMHAPVPLERKGFRQILDHVVRRS